MFRIYSSNYTENLAAVLAELMGSQPLDDPFAKDLILVQSHGMGVWLQQQVSQSLGVAAMIESTMPAAFIWNLAQRLLPEEHVVARFEKASLRWEIFERLPEKLLAPEYSSLKQYLLNSAGLTERTQASEELALYQLSERIADLFDAYQNYRPDWIAAWESGESVLVMGEGGRSAGAGSVEIEAWQADLWRSVYPDIKMEARRHRARQLQSLAAYLDQNSRLPPDISIPERIFVFGLPALPPQWLPLFVALSRHCEVHFLAQNPCRYYWGDILTESQALRLQQDLVSKNVSTETAADTFVEANPLLASWGKLGRDYVSLLFRYDDIDGVSSFPFDLYETPTDSCALGAIQLDLLNLEAKVRQVGDEDNSIRFARCHNRLREVEALRDHLLGLIDQQDDLETRDIVVMVPDVQDYAALFEAVFSRPVKDQNGQNAYLPFAVSDQALGAETPVIESFKSILQLKTNRVTASQLLDWLDIAPLRARFELSEDDLSQIKQWIHSLNIRWGLDEAHRDQVLGLEGSGEGNTWLQALSQLVHGYLYGADTLLNLAGRQALAVACSSSEQQVLAGKVMRLIDTIEQCRDALCGNKTVDLWLIEIARVWRLWFDPESVEPSALSLVDKSLSQLAEQVAHADFNAQLDFDIVLHAFSALLDKESVSQRFLAGSINVCTLMPMRSIPFKVVCMLGMNEGQYPRVEQRFSIDLLARTESRRGDRSRRDDDRYLFLEALCSAREHLYISYCGFDEQDNSERFPSVLVTELRHYCDRFFRLQVNGAAAEAMSSEAWTSTHHLQPFDHDYFLAGLSNQGRCTQTYSSDWIALHVPESEENVGSPVAELAPEIVGGAQLDLLAHAEESASEEAVQRLDLNDFVRALVHPVKCFYEHQLGLRFSGLDAGLEDDEPFGLNGLEQFSMKSEIAAQWLLAGGSEEALIQRWSLSGRLPREPVGHLLVDGLRVSMEDLKEEVRSLDCEEAELRIVHQNMQLQGGVIVSHGGLIKGAVEVYFGKRLSGRVFSSWVRHVVWNYCLHRGIIAASAQAADLATTTILLPDERLVLPALSASQSRDFFEQQMVQFVRLQSGQAPPAFMAKTAAAQLFDQAQAKVSLAYWGGRVGNYEARGDVDDPYWQRAISQGSLRHLVSEAQLPEFNDYVLSRQIACVFDGIEVTSR